jgi:hypothetical protein
MSQNWRKGLAIAGGSFIGFVVLVAVTYPFWTPRFMYLMMMTPIAEQLKTIPLTEHYALPPAHSGETIFFGRLEVPAPSGKVIKENSSEFSTVKHFSSIDGATSMLLIAKGISWRDAGIDTQASNIMFEGISTNYERDRLIWTTSPEGLDLWSASREKVGLMTRLVLKKTRYSMCVRLLEFENTHGVKGLICELAKPNTATISLFTKDDEPYDVTLFNVKVEVRDSIIAGIREH